MGLALRMLRVKTGRNMDPAKLVRQVKFFEPAVWNGGLFVFGPGGDVEKEEGRAVEEQMAG